jgi:hypothetical protein
MNTIWVIETHHYGFDSIGRHIVTTEVDNYFGYFTDREAAQAKADVLNIRTISDYVEYRADGAARRKRALDRHANNVRDWELLQAAGVNRPQPILTDTMLDFKMRPYELSLSKWLKSGLHTYYTIKEFAPNAD